MSGPVEVHRWAEVYRGLDCCGLNSSLPLPFIVTEITNTKRASACKRCGTVTPAGATLVGGIDGDPRSYVFAYRVRRLPDPPADPIEVSELKPETESA